MGIFRRLKITLGNLSANTVRELIAMAVILCLSIALSLPTLNEDLKRYHSQMTEDDGIQNSDAEAQGMDAARLDEAAGYMNTFDTVSFLVVRHGRIVLEKYYSGGRYDTTNVYSVTKSFVSALTGIAIRDGLIGGTDDSLEKYFPTYYKSISDPGWKTVNIGHLLTMTQGFIEESDGWTSSGDWVGYAFGLPLKDKPGEKFNYANCATHLLSVTVADAAGTDMLSYANKNLLEPLHFKNATWATDSRGYYTGYANMFLRPRDMAKFGCLYLNGGAWEGKQLVPKEWVEDSTRVQYDFNKEEDKGYENGYGYLWWISGETGYHMFSAVGYGGQYIDVIPALDTVVVITSTPNRGMNIDGARHVQLLEKYIIPSIKDK